MGRNSFQRLSLPAEKRPLAMIRPLPVANKTRTTPVGARRPSPPPRLHLRYRSFWLGNFLVIVEVGIHAPDVMLGALHVADDHHGREHRVILVVVLVHPVSPDRMQV